MNAWLSKICAFVLALAILPGATELLESAVHLVSEGHWAHAAAEGDHHEPTGPEHGCTPIFHLCSCHASLAFLSPHSPPATNLDVARFDWASDLVLEPVGFGPAIDHPPRV